MFNKLNKEKTYHWHSTKIIPCKINVYQRQTIQITFNLYVTHCLNKFFINISVCFLLQKVNKYNIQVFANN